MENKKIVINGTIRTPSYDFLDDILFNLSAFSHFMWIIGKEGCGKTHMQKYLKRKAEKRKDLVPIYINLEKCNSINDVENIKRELLVYGREMLKKKKHYFKKEVSSLHDPIVLYRTVKENIRKHSDKKITFMLLIDGLDKDFVRFRQLFRIQNQRFFEDLVDCNFYFFTSTYNNWEKKLDDYFRGETIKLIPFSSVREIKQILKLIDEKFNPKPEHCLHLLKVTKGMPSEVVLRGKQLIEDTKKMESVHNKFIVEHLDDIDSICKKFKIEGFRDRLNSWLRLFPTEEDKTLALKLADYIDYYDGDKIRKLLLEGYNNIKEILNISDPWNEIVICSGGGAGKSGDYLLYRLKSVANLWDKQLCHLEELKNRLRSKKRAVIFVDDFVGSGDNAIKLWNNVKGILKEIKSYLLLICGFEDGLERVKKETGFHIMCMEIIKERKSVLSNKNTCFTHDEKQRIKEICGYVDKKYPGGYGNFWLCIVFEHTTPNNTLSIIRTNTSDYRGLFPRRG